MQKKITFSKLQKTILLLGMEICTEKAEVTPAMVKVAYYRFPLRPGGRKLLFDRQEIGFGKYNSAGVAICAAFEHLTRKGMVTRNIEGINLTEQGREVAVKIRNNDLRGVRRGAKS